MHARLFAELGHNSRDALAHDILWIRLSRIDHVIDYRPAAEIRPRHWRLRFGIWFSRSHPSGMRIVISATQFVGKIQTQLAQRPTLIRHVLARVGDGSAPSHN